MQREEQKTESKRKRGRDASGASAAPRSISGAAPGAHPARAALRAAFPVTVPIMAGYWFLALTYGIMMNSKGFSFLWPTAMAAVIYGGSLEFVTASMLLSRFAPLSAFTMALMIQARHLFYGITMLDRWKNMGWKKFFLIFGMSDETFSVNYSAKIPAGIDRGWFYLWVTVLDWCYWVSGAFMGGLIGSLLPFELKGIDFCMTAMFVVIFLDQFRKEKVRWPALVGFAASAVCLYFFGADHFMIPSMLCILIVLTAFRRPLERAGADPEMEEGRKTK